MGSAVGRDLAGHLPQPDHLCRHRSSRPAARCRSTPEADERGALSRRGRGEPGRADARAVHALRAAPRHRARPCARQRGGHVMLCGGAPLDGPRHVWWNFVSSRRERINQAKEDWKAGRFALPPDDHDEYHPAARSAEDGELSMTDLTDQPASRCRPASRSTSSTAAREGGEPIVFLHGFPESHRTWRAIAPELAERSFRASRPTSAASAARTSPRASRPTRPTGSSRTWSRWPTRSDSTRFTLVGHDWGGAVAWLAALRHPDRIARLVIVNAPHPLVFQKSLIEDEAPARRLAIYQRLPQPGDGAGDRGDGPRDLLRQDVRQPCRSRPRSRRRRSAPISTTGARPGALTAMLNWYRASEIVVPASGEAAEAPAWTNAALPPPDDADAGHLGPQGQGAAAGPARRAPRAGRRSAHRDRRRRPAISSPGRSPSR